MTPRASTRTSGAAPPPTATAVAVALRPLLRAVIRRPGKLYNPVYVGPLPGGELVEMEARALAKELGVSCYTSADGNRAAVAWGQEQSGVFVCSPEHALVFLASSGGRLPARHQMIIWGPGPASSLTPALRSLVESGIAFDVVRQAQDRPSDHSLALACARCAQNPGRSSNPLVLFGAPGALSMIVDEVTLRLEAGGLEPVLSFGDPRAIDLSSLAAVGAGGAVVLRVVSSTGGHEWVPGIEELLGRGIQVVLAADARLREESRSTPVGGLLASGVAIQVDSDGGAVPATPSVRRWDRSSHWPPLSELLAGSPPVAPEATRVLSAQAGMGSGRSFSFEDLIQLVESGQLSGRLVVYTATELGSLEFRDGQLVSASLEGDRWSLERLLEARSLPAEEPRVAASRILVQHRALTIGTWKSAQMVFVTGGNFPEAETEGVAISADKFVYDLAMWLDEGPRNARRVGGLERVWRRVKEEGPAKPTSEAGRLWPHLDGQATLAEASLLAGVVDHEALGAIASLLDAHAIELVEDRPSQEVGLAPERVATTLASWGLVTEARALLEGLIESRPGLLSGGEWFLLGHLRAPTDSAGASAAFRRAVESLGRDSIHPVARRRLVDALLNVLLIETRSRAITAEVAWKTFLGKIEPGAGRDIGSPQHLAIITELALRAGDEARGKTWIARLRSDPTPEARGLSGALERVVSRGDS